MKMENRKQTKLKIREEENMQIEKVTKQQIRADHEPQIIEESNRQTAGEEKAKGQVREFIRGNKKAKRNVGNRDGLVTRNSPGTRCRADDPRKTMSNPKPMNRLPVLMAAILLLISQAQTAYALEYAQNFAKAASEQLFWVGLVVIIWVVVVCAFKKNFAGAITTLLLGAVILYFVKNPGILEEIGNKIVGVALGLG